MPNDTQSKTDEVLFQIDKDSFLEILKRAAARERTVVEFRTTEQDGERALDTAIDITEHVEVLEEQVEHEQ